MNANAKYHGTPLYEAVRRATGIVKLLLAKKDIDVNIKYNNVDTPLHVTVEKATKRS